MSTLKCLMSQFPSHVYKYLDSSGVKAVLKTTTLLWRNPLTFNDPFDIRLDLGASIDVPKLIALIAYRFEQLVFEPNRPLPRHPISRNLLMDLRARLKRQHRVLVLDEIQKGAESMFADGRGPMSSFNKNWHHRASTYRVLSFSDRSDSLLMWSHYAESHFGAVLRFRVATDKMSFFSKLKRVEYVTLIPKLASEEDWAEYFLSDADSLIPEPFVRLLCTKSDDWKYEKEWRVATHAVSDQPYDLFPFDPNLLEEIIIGCRARQTFIDEVKSLLVGPLGHVNVVRARLSETRFAIETSSVI